MNTIDVPVPELTPSGKSATELWEAVARSLDRILAVLTEREAMLAAPAEADAALNIYMQALRDIAGLAAQHASPGLEAVSRTMLQHVRDLRAQGQGLSHDDLVFLEQWPIHLATYLAAPRDVSAAQALVEHLQDAHWPLPLPAGEGDVMVALLQVLPGDEAGLRAAGVADRASAAESEPPKPEVAVSTVEPPLSEPMTAELSADTVSGTDTDAAPVLAELGMLLETAAQFGLQGLHEICLRVQQNVEHYQSSGGLDAAALARLQQFLVLGTEYLAGPEASAALVESLQNPQWPQPLSEDEAADLLSLLHAGPDGAAPATDEDMPSTSSVPAVPADAVVVADDAATLPVLAELDMLLEAADQFGLLGLHEMCVRVQQNVSLYQATNSLDATAQEQIQQFLTLGHEYMATPEVADVLVAYLQDAQWPQPLSDDEAAGLLFMLHEGQGETLPAEPASVPVAAEPVATEPVEVAAPMVDESLAPAMQSVNTELIGLLTQELEGIQDDLAQLLAVVLAPETTAAQRQEAISNYAEQLERLSMAAEAVGLTALHSLITSLYSRVQMAAAVGLSTRQHEVLTLLPGSLLAYLAAPDDPSTGAGLLDLLQGDIWMSPPAADYVKALLRGLAMVQLTQDSPDKVVRQSQATAEDVVLTLPADLNQELLDGLLHELPVHTGEFSAAIQRLAAGHGSMADIDVAKRAAHTLKGAANTVGIKGIATLTHHVEDILVALSKHATLPNRPLAETLSNAGDCLEAMGEAVMGTGPEPDYAVGVLQEVLDWANRIDQDGVPAADDDAGAAAPAAEAAPQHEEAAGGAAAAVSHESMIRVPANLIDELLRLMGENIISTGQVRERLRRLVQQNKTLQQQNLVFLQLATELEDQVDLGGAGRVAGAGSSNDTFDPLEFEHYSELHTISRRLIEAATDAGELSRDTERELGDLNELVEVQTRLNNQSQNTVLRTRMVPVATVASRLQRSVRQAARLLDKQVLLSVTGVDTMIDSNILNDLVDPLMHMLRNSVDHGVEMPEQRIARGKSGEGRITLSFQREGNQVVVRCRDDGAGLDIAGIRRSAQAKGLLATGQTMSDDELARLIFAPGFSTRDESTQVSGRGIGMDVVYSRVLQLKGTINLYPNPGQGLEIEIRLPATLISTYALLVRAQQHVFAISSYGITDIHYVTADQVQSIGEEQFFRLGDDIYPLADFAGLLHLPGSRRTVERLDGFPVLLVRQDNGSVHAVRVQEILDSSELVVKGLGRYVPKPQGVVGATILGDGSVAAVIDLPEVMRKPVRRLEGHHLSAATAAGGEAAAGRQSHFTALVVDDSLSARRATAQFMKDAGFEVRTAIDGLEAVSILDKWKPDIMLVDMEMPRMNGLELTAHVRARSGMTELPVIMITSRSTEKHRRQAEAAGVNVYLTKPFGDEQLLKHVMELTAH